MDNQKNHASDAEKLLAQMGSRTIPDVHKTAASKAAVRAHWQQAVQQNKQQKQRPYVWAVAASIMLMASLLVLNLNQNPENSAPILLASVSSFSGDIQWQQDNGDWQTLQSSASIHAGSVIKTSDNSFLTMTLTDASEIRVAANSEIMALPDVIELRIGQLYHDTDESITASPLTILTSQGTVEHIGTRYLVSSQPDEVKVAVRSGQVKMTTDTQGQTEQVLSSNQLAVLNANKDTVISDISSYDDLWDWTFMAQADFDLSNRSLYDFVQWYAHQAGLVVDWQNTESASKRVRLQGNIKNMSQEQAIKTVFYSTQYDYAIADGVLQISHQ